MPKSKPPRRSLKPRQTKRQAAADTLDTTALGAEAMARAYTQEVANLSARYAVEGSLVACEIRGSRLFMLDGGRSFAREVYDFLDDKIAKETTIIGDN